MMKLSIEKVNNGYIVRNEEPGSTEVIVAEEGYELDDKGKVEAIQLVLGEIVDFFGMAGSRYDKYRVYVEIKPGDKYVGETENDSEVCSPAVHDTAGDSVLSSAGAELSEAEIITSQSRE